MPFARSFRALLLMLAVLPLSGCLFRSRKVERQVSTAPLKTATLQELVDQINTEAAKIQTMKATVDIDTSVVDKTGKITDYKEIRGYVLVRKPAMLRMIGLMPIVRNQAFDMVSDGRIFKLWVPIKNKFVVGSNDVIHPSKQPLENIRPQYIYDALLLRPIDAQNEIAVLENGMERVLDNKKHPVDQPDYEVVVIRRGEHGWFLSRKIVFGRTDLRVHQQLIYDMLGALATEAHYNEYKDFSSVQFPSQIQIYRPEEGYTIVLNILKLDLNQPLTDEQFALQQPPGAQVVHLDQPNEASQLDAQDGTKPH
jgi:outer membrane lipoprotein-sorting protein